LLRKRRKHLGVHFFLPHPVVYMNTSKPLFYSVRSLITTSRGLSKNTKNLGLNIHIMVNFEV